MIYRGVKQAWQASQFARTAAVAMMVAGERDMRRSSFRVRRWHPAGSATFTGNGMTTASLAGTSPCNSQTTCGAIDIGFLRGANSAQGTAFGQSSKSASAFFAQASIYANALVTAASDASHSSGGRSSRRGRSPALCRSAARRSRAKKTLRRLGLASSSHTVARAMATIAGYAGGGIFTVMGGAYGTSHLNAGCQPVNHVLRHCATAKVVSATRHSRHLLRLHDVSQVRRGHSAPLISRKSQFNRDQCGLDRRIDRAVIGKGGVFQFHAANVLPPTQQIQLHSKGLAQ